CSASSRDSTPTISPSEPITRTRGTRISLLRRFCLSWVLIRGLRKWGYRGRHRAPAVRDGTDFERNPAAIQPSGAGFFRQPGGKGVYRHRNQVLAGPGPDRHRPRLPLAVPDHQQVGHPLQGVLADLVAHLLVAGIRFYPESL